MSEKPWIIIVSGLPCTGKTMLAKKIADRFSLPLIGKDLLKESLFDELGWKDREWSKKVSFAAYRILYGLMESLLAAKTSFVVDSNFKPEFDNQKFKTLSKKFDFEVFQIQCVTQGEILFERFMARSESSKRHPGHVDHLNYDEFRDQLLLGKYEPLDLKGEYQEIDTTDFKKIDIQKLFKTIRSAIGD